MRNPDTYRVIRSLTPCMPSTPALPAECQGCARLVDHAGNLKGWRTPVVMDATTVRGYFDACPLRLEAA